MPQCRPHIYADSRSHSQQSTATMYRLRAHFIASRMNADIPSSRLAIDRQPTPL
jgi:hypothetical protein